MVVKCGAQSEGDLMSTIFVDTVLNCVIIFLVEELKEIGLEFLDNSTLRDQDHTDARVLKITVQIYQM